MGARRTAVREESGTETNCESCGYTPCLKWTCGRLHHMACMWHNNCTNG